MSIESPADLAGIRAAGLAVGETLRALSSAVRPGITTEDLGSRARAELRRRGATSVPVDLLGFPGWCCVSVNEEAVHGAPGPRILRPGDLVKLDVTAALKGYVADAAVTVVVPPASALAVRLAECARAALARALARARAGRPLSVIGRAVEGEVRRQGFHVLAELCGHGTGRTMWEEPSVPNVELPGAPALREGLVLAVEPIIAAGVDRVVTGPDGWALRTLGGHLTAHAEHTVVIRHGRPLIVTAV